MVVPLSGGEELLVGLAQLRVAQKEKTSVLLRQGTWLPQQAHADIFKLATPLFAIAALAGSYQILPGALPTTRTWDDVIEGQITTTLAAILAGLVITQQDICA